MDCFKSKGYGQRDRLSGQAVTNNCLLSFLFSLALSFILSDARYGVPTVVNVFFKGPVLNEDLDS